MVFAGRVTRADLVLVGLRRIEHDEPLSPEEPAGTRRGGGGAFRSGAASRKASADIAS